MLQQFNTFLQRWMPVLTPLSLVIGVLLESIGQHLLFLVAWLFALMTFISSLGMKYSDVKVFKQYPKTILCAIAFLHILMPLWAFGLSSLIFDDRLLTIGFIISVAVPTGVTSLIWVTISKGNVPLSLAIVLIDTLLAPIILPILLKVVVGQVIQIDTQALIIDLMWMIVLPSILGVILNEKTKGAFQQRFQPWFSPLSKICLFLIVMINSSIIAPFVKNLNKELLLVIFIVLLISMSGYVFAFTISHFLFKGNPSIRASFLFNTGMRNIALGVVIASSYFPSKVAMPVVFGMLFQQVLASLAFSINNRIGKK